MLLVANQNRLTKKREQVRNNCSVFPIDNPGFPGFFIYNCLRAFNKYQQEINSEMNMFRTKVEIPATELKISYHDQVLTLGSCFAENIGGKLANSHFKTLVNPFGVLYNPVSIYNSIELLLGNDMFSPGDLVEDHSLWQSFSHSSKFSDTDMDRCLMNINGQLTQARDFFKNTNVLLVTFGTAWVFEDKTSGKVVSNCHKLPAGRFTRRRLNVTGIVEMYSRLIQKLEERMPGIQVVASVSPIRHWKDGANGNNLSKSILLLAADELQSQFRSFMYFPAYEIQLDELRDYRFYAADMQHPSDVAVDYIWQRFSETYFDGDTLGIKKEVDQLVSDLEHRPLIPGSPEFKKFRLNVEKRKAELFSKYPFLGNE